MPGSISDQFQVEHGENIVHFAGIRLRVTGNGNLKLSFHSLDDVRNQTLVPLVMQATTDREPSRLSNFISQRARLEVRTTEINENFRINRIIVFAKPIYTDYPG